MLKKFDNLIDKHSMESVYCTDYLTMTIGDVCTVGDGAHAKVERCTTGILYLTSKNINSGYLDLTSVDYISQEDYDKLFPKNSKATRRPEAGDVLMGIIGTFGNAYLYKNTDHFGVSSSVAILRPNRSVLNPSFLYYVVSSKSFKEAHNAYKGGSVQGYTNIPTIKYLPIPLPPLSQQKAIASLLTTLDSKIELNKRMNDTLEGIAQALFKSWFVDFDPVKAKSKGREPEGMDDATAALFPSNFTDLPEYIPEGWTAETLERVSFLNSESWSRNNTPDQIEYVDLANTKWGIIESTQIFSWKDAPSRAQRILRKGDTIVGTVRPGNGSYYFINLDGLTGSTGFAVLRPKEVFYREFVYLSATSTENIARLAHLADGAAYPAVRPDVVYATPILFPGDEILLRFSQCLSPIMEKVEINKKENKLLGDIRDLLLPRLISGKLRVDEISETVEASAS